MLVSFTNTTEEIRLDVWLSKELGISRSESAKLCKEDRVSLQSNAKILKASYLFLIGQSITVDMPEAQNNILVQESIDLDIVYQDDDILVVNKAVGMVVHPGSGNETGTLAHAVFHMVDANTGDPKRPGIVHRIDKDTSGLLVIARNPSAFAYLAPQFAEHSITRKYLALAWGDVLAQSITAPLGRNPHNRIQYAVVEEGKYACTHVENLGRGYPSSNQPVGNGSLISLIRCQLQTGRTHQIRVHLKHVGHALLCDPMYGNKQIPPAWKGKIAHHEGQLLHAYHLGFVHPNGEHMEFRVVPPHRFLEVAKMASIDVLAKM